MSALYGSITSDASQTDATRRGHRDISSHLRGWEHGVRTYVTHDKASNTVTVSVYLTSGSNGGTNDRLVGTAVNGVWTAA
jgi:hypothetical protein